MKKKILVIALSIAVMLMGAGYAYWTDQVNVDATLATGDINVVWHWQGWAPDTNGVLQTSNVSGNDGVRSSDGKEYTISLGNMYPGAVAKWDAQAINLGSIPVKVVNVSTTELSDPDNLSDFIEVKYHTRPYNIDAGWGDFNYNGTGQIWANDNVWFPLNDLGSKLNSDTFLKSYILKEGGRFSFGTGDELTPDCISFRLSPDAPKSLMDKSMEFKLTFDFEQAYK